MATSVADLHHVRLERQVSIERRPEVQARARWMRFIESTAARSADAVLTHSAEEAIWLRKTAPHVKVQIVPWHVPSHTGMTSFPERHGLAFLGSFDYAPNVDAATFLVKDIMPLVWRLDPAITCHLVGSSMPDCVRDLAQIGAVSLGHFAASGDVFDAVRLTVAPQRHGAGVKSDILSSFAAGIPCAMSAIAAEELSLSTALRESVGHNAAEIAAIIHQLHADANANRAVSAAGRGLIEAQFTETAVMAALRRVIDGNTIEESTPVAMSR